MQVTMFPMLFHMVKRRRCAWVTGPVIHAWPGQLSKAQDPSTVCATHKLQHLSACIVWNFTEADHLWYPGFTQYRTCCITLIAFILSACAGR
jgi:hypothetical protein